MNALEKTFFALLKNEICDGSGSVTLALNPKDRARIVSLAARHDLSHLLYDALTKNGLLSETDPEYAALSKSQMLAVYRAGEQARELETVQKFLNDAGIASLPLKGAVLRDLYPAPWMRTAADVDLLVPEEDAERAEALFYEKGYKLYFRSPHDVSYTGSTGVHIELHRTLSAKGEESGLYSETLANAWKSLTFDEGKPQMPDELFYFYHIFHMASHFKIGGCGVRSLLDLWLIDQKMPGNLEAREKFLAKEGLLTFAHNMERLASFWFSDGEGDEFLETLSSYLLLGGSYGTEKTGAYAKEGESGGKRAYRASRIFLPYRELKERYSVLEKHAYLYPFVTVARWFRALSPSRKKDVKKTLAGGDAIEKKLGVSPEKFWSQVGL